MVLLMQWRRQAEEAMQGLSRQLLEVQENERRHLARELHDEVMQTLTVLKLSLGAVAQASTAATRELEESVETVDDLVEQVRNLSLDLRPSMLDDLGLVAALEWYCERQARRLNRTTRHSYTQAASCESVSGEVSAAPSAVTAAVTSGV